MIGYHFTAARNWPKIQAEGLQPYYLNKPTIHNMYPDPNGVFIFPDDCENEFDRIGCVYYQAVTKKDLSVVELEIWYEDADRKPWASWILPEDTAIVTHRGTLGTDWTYHDRPLTVLSGPVPPDRITLRAAYDLRDILIFARDWDRVPT